MALTPVDRETHAPPPFPSPAGIIEAGRYVRRGGAAVGAWAVYFPLVGVALGVLWLITDSAVGAIAGPTWASVAVALVAAGATRARPLLALGRVLAALPLPSAGRVRALETGNGVGPSVCAALVLGLEIAVLCMLARYRVVGLVFAPLLGACGMVVLSVGSRAARTDGRRIKFAPEVTFREFGIASTATFAVVFLTSEFLGLLLVLATAAVTIAARVGLHRWIDGVNETAVLATGEAVQLLILALLAAL